MFRLAKIIGSSNTSEEVVNFNIKMNTGINSGSVVSCVNNVLLNTSADAFPDYVFMSVSDGIKKCYAITENMIFKVEFTSDITPKLGMQVGLSNLFGKADSVAYNTNGKGIIVGIESPTIVYVKFKKN